MSGDSLNHLDVLTAIERAPEPGWPPPPVPALLG
jgi:hypothetical protein